MCHPTKEELEQAKVRGRAEFGAVVRKCRCGKGMTLEELSELTGIRVPYLKKIESGDAPRFNLKQMIAIGDALGGLPIRFGDRDVHEPKE